MKIYPQRFLLIVFLVGAFFSSSAQAPNWSVNPNQYQYSLTITAVLELNCMELANPSNRLGAFVGSDVRGTALTSNSIGGRFKASMTIYSDSVNNETIYFKFYDVNTNTVYDVVDSIAFQDNAIFGSPAFPEILKNNYRPSRILITNDSIVENNINPTVVGSFSTEDLDVGQNHTYSKVAGSGDTDNSRFSISGNNLIANFVSDFETKASYSVRIRSTDNIGCSRDSVFSIFIKDINDPPTALSLSSNSIDENSVINGLVGQLSATDSDLNETFTYSLVSGAGGSDNTEFNINGNNLRANSSLNYENKAQYSIRIQVSDNANNLFVDTFKINVNDLNDAPTDIVLMSDSVFENQPTNTVITSLSPVDEDAGQSFAYSFNNVAGNDNALFNIVGNSLRTKSVFNFEAQDLYFIYIQIDDLNGGTFTKQISIRIIDANDAPTDLSLSTNSVSENMPIGSFVARIFSTDEDAMPNFSYSLVNGVGDADNANFSVRNDSLFTGQVLNLNSQSSHDIRVETNDGRGGTFSKTFTLTVKDINDIPTDIQLSNTFIAENTSNGSDVGTFTTTDADAGDLHNYSLVNGIGSSDNVSFSIANDKLVTNTTFDVNVKDTFLIRVQTDDGFGGVYQEAFILTITNANDNPTDILLSNDSIFESLPPNTAIGNFSTIDPDLGDTHNYSFVSGTNDNASFAIVGNQLRSAATYNFEAKSNYFITVQTADGNGGTFNKQFNINIKDTTDGPTDIALNNNLIAENSPSRTFIGIFSSTDEDANDSFTYTLVSGINSTDNAAFQIANDSLFSVSTFNFEARVNYNVRVRSSDASNLFTEKAFTIQVIDANDAPTDLSLSNSNVSEDATLNSTVGVFSTIDPDMANTHTYALVSGVGDADNDDFTITGNALKTDSVFDVNVRTAYTIRIRTSDGNGGSFEKAFPITITNANDAPTDISLFPSNINENLPANTLVGNFTSVDADANDNHIYTFANLSSNDNASFAIVGTELRTSASFDFETKAVYFIQIQSSDGNGGTYSRQLFVNVNDTNDTPTDIVLSANSVREKQPNGEFIGRLNSIDQDATDNFSYTFVNGTGDTDNSGFLISNDSIFSNTTFDVLIKSQLSIRLRTSDKDNKFFEKSFSIFVQDVNDAPTDITIDNASVPENTAVNSTVGNFTTADIDPMQSFSYQLVAGVGDTDNGNFIIAGGVLKTNLAFDFNTQAQHSIRVRSTDQGNLSTEKQFVINITNSNDTPTDISLTPNNFKENLPQSSLIGVFATVDKDSNDSFNYSFVSQGTNDNASFIISGDELRTGRNFDFETKNLYVIEVQTRDNAGATFSRQLTVAVVDSNDAPTALSISVDSVLEKSAIGTFVADLITTDEDASDSFIYSLVPGQGSNDNALFRINGNLLEVDSILNVNNAARRSVRIRSTDKGGRIIESAFDIRIININDTPVDIELSDTTVNEGEVVGSRVALISTVDEDGADTFTYELVAGAGDSDNILFDIQGSELLTNAIFDFEMQMTYAIRISVTDQNGGSLEKSFTIALTNGNEAPFIEPQFFSLQENLSPSAVIGLVAASDVDAQDVLSYRILGNQTDFNMMASTGELSSNKSFDYENQLSYAISVEVTDAGGLKDTAEINIEILDQIEATLPVASYFSPNGDGINDSWSIQNIELYTNYKLLIFNASGEVVFERLSNYNNDWDGTVGGSQLPEGIFYYYFEDNRDASNNFKGTITLKR